MTEQTNQTIEPKNVDDVTFVFPSNVISDGYLPPEEVIPEEFWKDRNDWCHFVHKWFAGALDPRTQMHPKEGIDAEKAFRHCAAIMRSFAPKHEHKTAGVAYLLSLWFDSYDVPKGSP